MASSTSGDDPVLLISGTGEDTGGGLFLFDGESVRTIDRLSSHGLAYRGGLLARLPAGDGGELLVYDETGVQSYLRLDDVSQPHDVAWVGDGLLVVSTSSNSVLRIEGGRTVSEWRFPGEGDAWHLNNLFVRGDELYVSAFGQHAGSRDWADEMGNGQGFVLNLETGERVLEGLNCPHNPRHFDGSWSVCNSYSSELLQFRPDSTRIRRRVQLDGWTRGVAVTDDDVFVGESVMRTVPTRPGTASLAVLSRETLEVKSRFALPCREIYDVITVPASLVPGLEAGFRTNSRRTMEQGQLAMFDAVGVSPARLWALADPLPSYACRAKVTADVPSAVSADSKFELECTVQNTGSAIYVSADPNPVHLSYRWFDARTGEEHRGAPAMRAKLPGSLPPGESAKSALTVRAPTHPGDYTLRVTLVQEHVRWFDDLDEGNARSQPVTVVGERPGLRRPRVE